MSFSVNLLTKIVRRLSYNSMADYNVAQKRIEYLGKNQVLHEHELESHDPLKLFKVWFQKADSNKMIREPNAACLATATKDGVPSARFVLLKYFDSSGFTFFTNSDSRKGRELEENPRAAMTFYWDQMDRSVRIEGRVEKMQPGDSSVYFSSRPRASQIGAHVSRQSTVIASREYLEKLTEQIEAKYKDKEVPKPDYWNGYKIIPHSIEFWQGQSDRLHDRIQFIRSEDVGEHNKDVCQKGENGWVFYRLSP
ncbi:pyridoxine/pyridoxamine 5'-phosphate oxidase isoform X2 [Adelges cooleyi]|uniref:pyridoxine/pyridoxamine 5'-phosphate oxidase isoform X2 n=1 Tax=Adelges cooleyi TaxID=133065 RepID=UPI0021806E0B|nr:pyridoxine/pyridoxamine 5'-phosphate oxidase isoform X2 [Adelges cooleyi]